VQIMDDSGQPLPTGREGEVCVRGPNIMMGYWHDPEATRAVLRDGWLRTGDVGKLDADGYLYITDRLKDLIIKGGENISPRQIEDVLIAHPAVAEVAVIGIPDKTLGEDMIAVIVLRRGHNASESEILEHAGRTLSKFKAPTRVVFRDELPKNGVGKILKRELRRELSPARGRAC
jgi:long-chain acyl-CoA synthetase